MPTSYTIQILVEAKDKNTRKIAHEVRGEIEHLGDTAERTGDRMRQAFTGAAIAMTFGRAIPVMRNAIGAYNELRAGMVGLQSVVKYAGENWDRAQAAVKDYISDGLVPMSQATTALKNLLLRGYGLEKSIELMKRFKDSAAYGRQGQLSMGQAIVSAAEGLKNENSILVDNAGVTKNVSVMWKEYAAQIGKTVGHLTKVEKLQAEYNGIVEETAAMTGNAAQLTGELAGKMAQTEAQVRELKEAIGGALAPSYADLLSKIRPVIQAVKDFAEANPQAIVTLLGGAGLVAAVGALAAAFTLIGPGGILIVGIAAAIIGLAAGVATLTAKLRPSTEALEKAAVAADEKAKKLRALRDEYIDLSGKPDASAEEHERLRDVIRELRDEIPQAVQALNDEGEALSLNLSRIRAYVEALDLLKERKIAELMRKQALEESKLEEVTKKLEAAIARYSGGLSEAEGLLVQFDGNIQDVAKALADQATSVDGAVESDEELLDIIEELMAQLVEAELNLKRTTAAVDRLTGATDDAADANEDLGDGLGGTGDAALAAAGSVRVYNAALKRFFDEHGGIPETLEEWIELFKAFREELFGGAEDLGEAFDLPDDDFRAKLKRMTDAWGNWADLGVASIDTLTDGFSSAMMDIVSGNKSAKEALTEMWGQWFEWMLAEIIRLTIKLAMLELIKWVIPGFSGGGEVVGTYEAAGYPVQHGGRLRGGIPGLDSILFRGMPGELVTSVKLTGGLERMVAAFEAGRMPAAQVVPIQTEGGLTVEQLNITALDASSIRTMFRSGRLGREWYLAQLHNKLPRYG